MSWPGGPFRLLTEGIALDWLQLVERESKPELPVLAVLLVESMLGLFSISVAHGGEIYWYR